MCNARIWRKMTKTVGCSKSTSNHWILWSKSWPRAKSKTFPFHGKCIFSWYNDDFSDSKTSTIDEYKTRCQALKEQTNYVEPPTLTNKIRLKPSLLDNDHAVREMNQIHDAKYANSIRRELLGGDLRQRVKATSTSGSDDMNEAVKHHASVQEKIAEDMLALTKSLKEQTQIANRIIRNDTEVGVSLGLCGSFHIHFINLLAIVVSFELFTRLLANQPIYQTSTTRHWAKKQQFLGTIRRGHGNAGCGLWLAWLSSSSFVSAQDIFDRTCILPFESFIFSYGDVYENNEETHPIAGKQCLTGNFDVFCCDS